MGTNQGSIQGHTVDNYLLGTGILYLKMAGDVDFVDAGAISIFEFLPKVTKLDHFIRRHGSATKDKVAVTKKEGTLTINFEEASARIFAMMVLGPILDSGLDSPGGEAISIDILAQTDIEAQVKFVGDCDFGPHWTILFPIVQFTPSKGISLMASSDAWAGFEMTGDVLADTNGHFGTASAVLNSIGV